MANAADDAVGKIDGRNPDIPGYPSQTYTPVGLYRECGLRDDWVTRPEGGEKAAYGGEWWTPSTIDKITVLAEILGKKYHGVTLAKQINALFAKLIEGRSNEDIINDLYEAGYNPKAVQDGK